MKELAIIVERFLKDPHLCPSGIGLRKKSLRLMDKRTVVPT